MTTTPAARETRPDTFFMGVIHDAMRHDFTRLTHVVENNSQNLTATQRRHVTDRTLWLLNFLHTHHDHEDNGLWPLLRGRSSDLDRQVAAMEIEHAALAAAMPEVEHTALAWQTSPANSGAFLEALGRLRAVLDPHLTHEEEVCLPLAEDFMTAAEWTVVSRKSSPKNPVEALAGMAWFLDGLDPERTAKVKSMLPGPAWVLVTRLALPLHRRAAKRRWGVLDGS